MSSPLSSLVAYDIGGMRRGGDLFLDARLLLVKVQIHDVLPDGHGGGDGAHVELEDVADQVLLLFPQKPGHRPRLHHGVEVVRRDVVPTLLGQPKGPVDGAAQGIEDLRQRGEDEDHPTHPLDRPQGHSLGDRHGDSFGDEVREEDEEEGDPDEGNGGGDLPLQGGAQDVGKQLTDHRRQKGIPYDARQDGHGVQPNLNRCEEQPRLILKAQDPRGTRISALGDGTQLHPSGCRQRYLRKGKESADRRQDQNDQKTVHHDWRSSRANASGQDPDVLRLSFNYNVSPRHKFLSSLLPSPFSCRKASALPSKNDVK